MGFNTQDQQPPLKWCEDCSAGILDEFDLSSKCFVGGYHQSGDQVAMSTQVFCCTVNNNIGTQCKWLLQSRRCESIIYAKQAPACMCNLGNGLDVGYFEGRVGGGFNPDKFGIRRDGF